MDTIERTDFLFVHLLSFLSTGCERNRLTHAVMKLPLKRINVLHFSADAIRPLNARISMNWPKIKCIIIDSLSSSIIRLFLFSMVNNLEPNMLESHNVAASIKHKKMKHKMLRPNGESTIHDKLFFFFFETKISIILMSIHRGSVNGRFQLPPPATSVAEKAKKGAKKND